MKNDDIIVSALGIIRTSEEPFDVSDVVGENYVIFKNETDMVYNLEDNSYVSGQGTVNTQRCRLGIDNDGQLIDVDNLSKIVLCGKEYIFN